MVTFRFDPFAQLDSVVRQQSHRPMPMDLVRHGDNYVLTTDLPGVDADSIDVDIDNGVLTISAKRSGTRSTGDSTPEDAAPAWLTNERFTGTYRRQVTVSDSVDTEKVTADYSDGVLTVTLPVSEKARSRKISVNHAGGDKLIEA